MATREQNEREFSHHEELPGGGRKYWKWRRGWRFGSQKIVKVVDANEDTIRVVQEIYDDEDVLIEYHVKFPIDRGHTTLLAGVLS